MSCAPVPLFLFIEGWMMSCGGLGLRGALPPPPTPPAGASGTRGRLVRGRGVVPSGGGGCRAVGGAGITIPAEADRGATAPL